MDEELKRLNLATAAARKRATDALDALRAPQATLREAAADYIASAAARRLDASRRASVEVMARLSDDDVAELRLWTEEEIENAREAVRREIESCDFWFPDEPGLSPTDVTSYSNALMSKPRDTRSGVPQELAELFDRALTPMRRGLGAIGLAVVPADGEPQLEIRLVRAWRTYREAAVECVVRWADVDEHYHTAAERFQEMRWELAAEADAEAIAARRAEAEARTASVADQAKDASGAPVEAVTRGDSETLIPAAG